MKKLGENPDDEDTIQVYVQKAGSEIAGIARSKPTEAEEKLKAATKFLAELKDKSQNDATKSAIDTAVQRLSSLESTIEDAKKMELLIGQDASPLKVESWVNGEPMTESDVKGKVVLLDFWAVWCGPCIATFPHLREWHEKYADQGLVIIGVTSYYNYAWDAEKNRAVRSQEQLSPEQEQEMLVKFAEEHSLKHRFAIQEGRDMSEFYGVSGIPHVVLIDREGKIRLMRVGSGEQNAADVQEMLEKVL